MNNNNNITALVARTHYFFYHATACAVVYRGEDAVDKFLECLEEEQKYIQENLDFVEPMRIQREEERAFQDAIH